MELKPCPFCGAEAFVQEMEITKCTSSEVIKENWHLFQKEEIRKLKNGRTIKVFRYRVQRYSPRCETPNCPGHCSPQYESLHDAIEAWNRREEK